MRTEIRHRLNSIDYSDPISILYLGLVASLVFSVEIPVGGGSVPYLSVNSEDVAILLLVCSVLITVFGRKSYSLEFTYPDYTLALLLTTGWIVLSTGLALFRTDESLVGSTLWLLKWLEGVVFYFILQKTITRHRAVAAIRHLLIMGTLLSFFTLAAYFLGAYRPRLVFDNPNTLCAFLLLPASLWLSRWLNASGDSSSLYLLLSIVPSLAIITTLSRSGVFALLVLVTVHVVMSREKLAIRDIAPILSIPVVGILFASLGGDGKLQRRLTGWLEVDSSGVTLSGSTSAQSFETRLDLIHKAVGLIERQPIFGHGWYASPTRVGYLDIHYTTLLVDVGIVGFLLFMFLYIITLRGWFRLHIAQKNSYAGAAFAWYGALLAQAIGGNFPRVPHLMYITILMVVCVHAIDRAERESG
jgi:O-antigen ligase